MPLSKEYRFLFVHIPKTGGTSIENAFNMFYSWRIENTDNLFGLIQSEALLQYHFLSHYLQHLTLPQIHSLKPETKNYFSFSFVRNPWDKIVSIYHNTDPNLLEIADKQGIELRNLSFSEFVPKIIHFPHIHLLDQHLFIMNAQGQLLIDFLGRFENLETDFKRLCQQLNIEIDLPHKNQSKHDNYHQYYDAVTKNLVAQRYAKDIALFHYQF